MNCARRRFLFHPAAWLSAGALATTLSLGACGGAGGLAVPTGGLVVQMHDSPIASSDTIHEVNVTITGIHAAMMVNGDEQVVPIASNPDKYDLLSLQHGLEAIVAAGSFPAGEYRWIRL